MASYQNLSFEQLMQINVDETVVDSIIKPVIKALEHNKFVNQDDIYKVSTFAYQVYASFLEIQGHSFEKNTQRELSSYITGVAASLYWFTKQVVDDELNILDLVSQSSLASIDDMQWLEECTVKHTFWEKRRNDLLAKVVYDVNKILPKKSDSNNDRDHERLRIYHYLKLNKSVPVFLYDDDVLLSVKALKSSGITGFFSQVSNEKKSPFIKYFNMHNNDKTDTTRKFVVIGKKGELKLDTNPAINPMLDEVNDDVSAIDQNVYAREQQLKFMEQIEKGRHIEELIKSKTVEEQNPVAEQKIIPESKAIENEQENNKKDPITNDEFDATKFKYLTSYKTKVIDDILYLVFDTINVGSMTKHKAIKEWERCGLVEKVDDKLLVIINGTNYVKIKT